MGNINPALGILENVFEADVKIKNNEVDDCFLELDWTLTKKKDFIFVYKNDSKIPLNDLKSFCQINGDTLEETFKNVEDQFTAWDKVKISQSLRQKKNTHTLKNWPLKKNPHFCPILKKLSGNNHLMS